MNSNPTTPATPINTIETLKNEQVKSDSPKPMSVAAMTTDGVSNELKCPTPASVLSSTDSNDSVDVLQGQNGPVKDKRAEKRRGRSTGGESGKSKRSKTVVDNGPDGGSRDKGKGTKSVGNVVKEKSVVVNNTPGTGGAGAVGGTVGVGGKDKQESTLQSCR